MNEILAKLKGVLDEADLNSLSESISSLVEEKFKAKIEESKSQWDAESEITFKERLDEETVKLSEKFQLELEEKIDSLEEKMLSKLDQFLESEISESISEDILNKIAINETCEPIVKEICAILEDKYVSIDSDGSKIIEASKKEVTDLKESSSKLIAEKLALKEELEKLKVSKFIYEGTVELPKDKRETVTKMFEGKSFSEVEKHLAEYVTHILEESITNTRDSLLENNDGIKKDEPKTEDDNKPILSEAAKIAGSLYKSSLHS